MKFSITLTKTIVLNVEAEDEGEARFIATNEGTNKAEADGTWANAGVAIQHVELQD